LIADGITDFELTCLEINRQMLQRGRVSSW